MQPIIRFQSEYPEKRIISRISENLLKGEVYVFPTDSVYALIADFESKKGVDKLYKLKDMPRRKPLALHVKDISQASLFIRQIDTVAFRLLKQLTPGPYTLIFEANKDLPRYGLKKTTTIGIRISDHPFMKALLDYHPNPVFSTSVLHEDAYLIDLDELEGNYGHRVAGIVDGGIGSVEVSTIIDFTDNGIDVIREGKGMDKLNEIMD